MRTLLIASLAMLGCASARIGTARIAPAGGGEERTFDVEAGHLAGFDSGGRRLQLWTFSNLFAGCESAKLTRALDGAPLLLVAICREPGEGPAQRFRLEVHKAVGDVPVKESFEVLAEADGGLTVRWKEGARSISLAPGAVGDALRRHPELIATALVLGVVPPAPDGRYAITAE